MNKKSSSFFRIDEQVFFTMAGLCVLSLIVMAFRWSVSTPCYPIKVTVKTAVPVVGNIVRFDASTQNGQTFSWNFGDGSTKDEMISVTNHEYKNAGRYTVTVLVNGQCSDMQDVYVGEAPVVINTNLQPIISADPGDTAYVNQPISFSDNSTATKWEWRFGQTSSIDAIDRNPVYTYTVPGRKTVRLKVNDRNDMVAQYSILVLETPVEKPNTPKAKESQRFVPQVVVIPAKPNTAPLQQQTTPEVKKEEVREKPKAPALTNEQLKSMLMQVADGQKRAEDFSEYLGGQLGISVTMNNNVMPFTKMCEELKGMKKKIKELKVIPVTDRETNHILSMNVVVEKKKFLGVF